MVGWPDAARVGDTGQGRWCPVDVHRLALLRLQVARVVPAEEVYDVFTFNTDSKRATVDQTTTESVRRACRVVHCIVGGGDSGATRVVSCARGDSDRDV